MNLYYPLIFLYFLTSSMEKLYFNVGLFKVKATNFIAIGLFILFILERKAFFFDKRHRYVFLSLLSSFVLSALLGSYLPRTSVYVLVFVLHFFAYYLLTVGFFYWFNREKILKIYILSFFAIGAYGIFQFVISLFGVSDRWAGQFYGHIVRVNAFCYEPSYYVLYLCPVVFFVNYLYFYTNKFSLKQVVLLYVMLFVSLSTSAFFFYLLTLGFFVFLKSSARDKIRTFVMSSSCGMVAMAILFKGVFVTYFFKFFSANFITHHSFIGRWRPILLAVQAWAENPWFGVGMGGVGPYFIEKFQIRKFGSLDFSYDAITLLDPANTTTELLASLGLVGGSIYVMIFYFAYRDYKGCFKLPISEEEQFLIKGLFFSWIMMLVISQFNPGWFRPYAWIHTGVVFGYIGAVNREKSHDILLFQK